VSAGESDFEREWVAEIDSHRSLMVVPTTDGATLTLLVEDPHSFAVVELTRSETEGLIEALKGAIA
jgi:hypothetical protein